jgi:hypothetical protein
MSKRFIVIYKGQAFPVRSKSAEKIKADILNAYVRQDGKENVTFQSMSMVSTDIALGRYVIKDLDEWFDEESKKKGSTPAPLARSTV